MSVFVDIVAFVIVADSMGVVIASSTARVSASASLLVFLALLMLVFRGGWHAAARVSERHILRHGLRQH